MMIPVRLPPAEPAPEPVDLRRLASALSPPDDTMGEPMDLRGLSGAWPRRPSTFARREPGTAPAPPAAGRPVAPPPNVVVTRAAAPPPFAVAHPVLEAAPAAAEPAPPRFAAPPWPSGDEGGSAAGEPGGAVLYCVATPLRGSDGWPLPGTMPAEPMPVIETVIIPPPPPAPQQPPSRQPGPMPELPRPRRPEDRTAGQAAAAARPDRVGPARLDPAVAKVLTALGLIAAYIAICLAPLVIVSIDDHGPRRPFLVEFSVALGYVGLSMMVLQFTLVSRIKWLARPFGIDVLQRFHREVSFVALAFVFAHPLLLLVKSVPTYLPLLDVRTAPWRARYAVLSLAALLLVVFVSVWRRKLRLSYEVWKVSHGVLSTAVMFFALAHMVGVNRLTGQVSGRLVVYLVAGAIMAVLAWSRLIAPRLHLFRPWRVVEVVRERGRAVTLVVEPERHPGWSFMPGQFAWVTVGRSPFRVTQHPFSLSSPGEVESDGRITLTIKERGDWTQGIGSIAPGTRLYLDGPHGSFSIDMKQAPGYVFVAGGVGITPIYSMISTMCLREDNRPAILFYASSDWESITFREQLDELSSYMANLRVVHVLKSPPPGWQGESGHITTAVLRRNLPRQHRSFEYFLCASETMMKAIEESLMEIGVPGYRIHTERFGLV
jgi:predicted ferric reductase